MKENINKSNDFSNLSLSELKETLAFKPEGIKKNELQIFIEKYGFNEIPVKKINPFFKFLSYFWGPIPWMIEGAVILSGVVEHWADFFIILTLLIMNAVIGYWEEYHAQGAIEALKEKLASKAKVKRDNKWQILPARELVPGDYIRVRLGDIIPADAKVLSEEDIEVDQSALTGESLPATKKKGENIYSGAVVKRGEADALVYATGAKTFLGKTAQLVEGTQVRSHFQKAVLKIGNYLILLAIVLVVLILFIALFRGDPMLETMEFALILTVAAIPVAMPTVLSVTMAVGGRVLAKKEAIVSRLVSIEELAGMDILCSDKTGTLTQNKLKMGEVYCLPGYTAQDVIKAAAFASKKEDEDAIDLAILSGLTSDLPSHELISYKPFDPVSKRTEAKIKLENGKIITYTKGAPQVILKLMQDVKILSSQIEGAVEQFAKRGFRSLGVACTDENNQWIYLGVIPLFDPPRIDSKETIAAANEMGIDVKMITGDQVAIGKEVASQVGIGSNILDVATFDHLAPYEQGKISELVEQADGFAQVFPEHKYHIVEVLQKNGHIVGMTGDGVNDSPALKIADAGIAVSGATDAARASADIVLLQSGLSVIIDAIKESRKIFQRMNSYAIYRITETIRVLLFMTLSILVFNFYPVTAVMIVLLAILNDGAILTIAYDRVRYSQKPEAWNMPYVLGVATVLGIMGVIASFGLFYLGERVWKLDRETIQTLMYLKLSVAGHLTIFVTRTRRSFWSIRPARSLFLAVVGTQIIATIFAVYGIFMKAIGWEWALIVWGYALFFFFLNDRVKIITYKYIERSHKGSFLFK